MPLIPFLDLKACYQELRAEIDAAVGRVLASGWYVLGPEVAAFEEEFAQYVGAARCVGVGNGLDALSLALRCCGVGPGDEVIVPANTYIATWLAVVNCGATPVPVEPNPATHCIDPDAVVAALTSRTKALLPVHLYGHPADIEALLTIRDRYGLKMIEDAAQAHGALIKGVRVGGMSDAVAWSFYPTKNLGALGDAGAVTTNDSKIADRLASLRNYGSFTKNENHEKGMNSRLDPLQAAVLRVKLPQLADWNARRGEIARRYEAAFRALPIGLPSVSPDCTHAWHAYVITHPRRDELQARLFDSGVATMIHYPIPPFRQQAFAELNTKAHRWPLTDRLAREVLSLPIGPHTRSEDVEAVISTVGETLLCL
jgi:dTDP-4-amino-4,6-dideoxygalactose transaminase